MPVRVVVDDGSAERELVVRVEDRGATVGELLVAAGLGSHDAITVDGRVVPADHTVAEAAIRDGALLVPGRRPHAPPTLDRVRPAHRVAVVAGTCAGAAVDLDRPVVVGRGDDADLRLTSTTVSEQHCRIVDDGRGEVTVTDLGSTNGTWVEGRRVPSRGGVGVPPGGVVRCGAVALRVERAVDDTRPRAIDPLRHLTVAHTVPFNRPPRPGRPPVPDAVGALPPEPAERTAPRFDALALVTPLLLGGVMVVVMGDLRFALFVLLSPVMLLMNTIGETRRSGRESRAAARDHRDDVARFVDEVERAGAAATARAWELTPSIAEVRRRGLAPSTRLWERRRLDDDQLVVGAGIGSVPFRPRLTGPSGPAEETPLAREILDAAERLPDAPVTIDLSRGGVVGVVGDRAAALSLARSLMVQAAVHHGPADLAIAAVVDERAVGPWTWLPWLPHTAGAGPDAPRLLGVGPASSEALLRSLLDAERRRSERSAPPGGAGLVAAHLGGDGGVRPDRRTLLLLVDSPAALRGRDAPARAVLRGDAGPVAGIVLVAAEDELPAVCDTVVVCGSPDGDARLVRPAERELVHDLLVAGLAERDARLVARRLAGLEDPELALAGAELPARVDLLDLLEIPGDGVPTAASIAAGWAATADGGTIGTPIGTSRDGTFHLDLREDGPHGLLGGTTGSGKSELLRSLVAGLAARHDPDHLTFVLVDYKGGAAFDACADLPHVVGLVTDLDEHLGERALRSLEAELEHRERRLRRCRVSDLDQWSRLGAAERGDPMPRLLVVVDEFATLKAELPDFVAALVAIAQRGRSLGVHMLLGTQRPSGAVDENVRANSNLRIALRVTDRQDSTDVVGVPDAAEIPPSLPGRGVVRIGPGAVVPVQTALVTGRSGARSGPQVQVTPLRFGGDPSTVVPPGSDREDRDPEHDRDADSDLARLVAACRGAADLSGVLSPRRPWLPPLPSRVPLGEIVGDTAAAATDTVPMAIVDLPEQQAQRVAGWDLAAGPLLLHGVVGAGTTTAAAAAVLAAARLHGPDDLHVQVIDLGRGELVPLDGLPHVGTVVTGREEERRRRLLRWLLAEGARRRRLDAASLARLPRLLVVVDGFGQLLDELDDPATYDEQEALVRFVAGSASLRVSCLLTTTRVGGLRSSLTSAVEQRWALRLAAPDELAMLGLRPAEVPALPPGRAVRASDGRLLQIGDPGPLSAAVAAVAAATPSPSRSPTTVGMLPSVVPAAELAGALATPRAGAWQLPVGRDDDELEVASLPLHAGEHALLLGPPASGRTGALGALAEVAAARGLDVVVSAGAAGSPLLTDGHEVVEPAALGELLGERAASARPLLVLVDDAERVPDPGGSLDALAGEGVRVHLVCAARPEAVQADFGHWLRRVARARVGAVLRPTGDAAGDLLGVRLPRRAPAALTVGRGWLVAGGRTRFAQLATPSG